MQKLFENANEFISICYNACNKFTQYFTWHYHNPREQSSIPVSSLYEDFFIYLFLLFLFTEVEAGI